MVSKTANPIGFLVTYSNKKNNGKPSIAEEAAAAAKVAAAATADVAEASRMLTIKS
ncbi:UNVERIFIED_CONTAM: hypothetical protein Slati_3090300 [Sesamum latifolium]|uniref:Peroxisomal membrane protein PEX14 central plants domain-containing protein n=1 Tax=Sesamum latifolium TaxID=2727402 RepID=A0AAW2UV98_9LAMI